MKLNQLKNLVAAVEIGSIRGAAQELNISQPAITKSIHLLEQSVGAKLLDRGTHGVTPTRAGQAIVERAKIVEAELRRAQNDVDVLEGARAGEISIGATAALTMNLMPDAVLKFKKQRPKVEVYVEEGIYSEIMTDVRLGQFDFAVCLLPGVRESEGLNIKTLLDDKLIPAVRRGHPLTAKSQLSLADLTDEDWIIYGVGEGRRIIYEQTFLVNGLTPPASSLESNSFSFAMNILTGSDMIALLPQQLFSGASHYHDIQPLVLSDPLPSWQVAVVTRADSISSPLCKEFIRELETLATEN